MAVVSKRFVHEQLKALIGRSQGVKKLVHDALERLESEPRSLETLEDVPAELGCREDLYFPKVKITSGSHDYRILAVGIKREDGEDYVELLYVFGGEMVTSWIGIGFARLPTKSNREPPSEILCLMDRAGIEPAT
jgi:hypothetical protein